MLVIPTSLLTDLSGVGVAGHIGTGGSVISCHCRRMDSIPVGLHNAQTLTRDSDHEPSVTRHDDGAVNCTSATLRFDDKHPRRQCAANGHRVGIALFEGTHVKILTRSPGASCCDQEQSGDPEWRLRVERHPPIVSRRSGTRHRPFANDRTWPTARIHRLAVADATVASWHEATLGKAFANPERSRGRTSRYGIDCDQLLQNPECCSPNPT